MHKKTNKFSPEVRERAVRPVQENQGESPSLWAAVAPIALKINGAPQPLLDGVNVWKPMRANFNFIQNGVGHCGNQGG